MSSVHLPVSSHCASTAAPDSLGSAGLHGASGSRVQLKRAVTGRPLDVQLETLSPVQRKGGEDTAAVHEAAQQGIASGGGAMPFADKIQASFGAHDIGDVQAHTGAAASQANKAMGAEAYATGNHVAFGGAPDLHTAAHEVAHVVQQRAGVSLSGGVGQSGDSYEQHADKVADKVVAGESAEGLLGEMTGGAPVQKKSARAIQRAVVQREEPAAIGPNQTALRASDPTLEQNVAATTNGVEVGNYINSTFLMPVVSGVMNGAVEAAVANIRDAESPTVEERLLKSALMVGAAAAGAFLTPAVGVGAIIGAAVEDGIKEGIGTFIGGGPNELGLSEFQAQRLQVNTVEQQKMADGIVSSCRAATRDGQFLLARQWKTALTGDRLARIGTANRNHVYDAWIEAAHQKDGTGEDFGEATTGRLVVRCYFSAGHFAQWQAWGASATIDGLNNEGGQRMANAYLSREFGQMAIRRDLSFQNGGGIRWNAGQDPEPFGLNYESIHSANYPGQAYNEASVKTLLKAWWSHKTPSDIGASSVSGDAPGMFD